MGGDGVTWPCPVCWQAVTTGTGRFHGRIKTHTDTIGSRCPMSLQPVPAECHRAARLETEAAHVVCMAAELRDDLTPVWDTLAAASPTQLRDWLIIALAAVDIERPISDLFQWVQDMPIARYTEVAA